MLLRSLTDDDRSAHSHMLHRAFNFYHPREHYDDCCS